MGQKSLIYSFVARGTVIIAEYTEFKGNFTTVASQGLQKLPENNNRFSYNCDGHTFNYLTDNGYTFCIVAVESAGKQLPLGFLERVKDDFHKKYPKGKASTAAAKSLSKSFGPKMKEQMQYCVSHPEEIDKIAKVKAQVSEVKGVMLDNIEKVMERGEKVELLVDKTDNLRNQGFGEGEMGQKSLIYSFVARGTVIIAEYTEFKGNFTTVASQVESAGKQLPLGFLERVKDDFHKKYPKGKASTAAAKSLSKSFGPKMKEQMQYCVSHPEEIDKIAKVKAQVSEVKGVMLDNIEKVMERGEKVELLVDKTDNLRNQASDFKKQGTKMKRKMWIQNMKIKLIIAGIVLVLILVVILSICNNIRCW
ncbi:hypothetical protein SSX86_012839 [Deinandra increscens subsp. villosa]|uniref:Uncharacterized protein n=1 Tax=Deinandra increscens subsp. villosa TaxID=3103831 RepID=A0AAP0DCI8_9ASTR